MNKNAAASRPKDATFAYKDNGQTTVWKSVLYASCDDNGNAYCVGYAPRTRRL